MDNKVADISGPPDGKSVSLHAAPPKNLAISQKTKVVGFIGLSVITLAIVAGIMMSGQNATGTSSEDEPLQIGRNLPPVFSQDPNAGLSSALGGAGGTGAATDPRAATNAPGASAGSGASGGQGGGAVGSGSPLGPQAGANGGGAAGAAANTPTPAQAHRQWLEKRHYERLQARYMAAEMAITAKVAPEGVSPSGAGQSRGAVMPVQGNTAASGSGASGLASQMSQPSAIDQRLAENRERQAALMGQAAFANNRGAVGGVPGGIGGVSGAGGGMTGASRPLPQNIPQAPGAHANQALPEVYHAKMVDRRVGEHEVVAGSVIPAVLVSGINSDLPGSIIAQVRQAVYDTHNPNVLVIPQGSRLIGRYSSDVQYGQNRALVVWDSLVFPNGNSISLAGMQGTDGQGMAGLQDQVNNHFWRIWSSALLTSLLGAGVQLSQPDRQSNAMGNQAPTAAQEAAAAAANSLNQAGGKILERNLNLSPTITVRPGYLFNVMVNRTMILPAYR